MWLALLPAWPAISGPQGGHSEDCTAPADPHQAKARDCFTPMLFSFFPKMSTAFYLIPADRKSSIISPSLTHWLLSSFTPCAIGLGISRNTMLEAHSQVCPSFQNWSRQSHRHLCCLSGSVPRMSASNSLFKNLAKTGTPHAEGHSRPVVGNLKSTSQNSYL